MSKFKPGDVVAMPGVPMITVEVLEIGRCQDEGMAYGIDGGSCGAESFRFADPETGEDDWMHTEKFEKVTR